MQIRFLLPALSVFNVAAAAGLDSLLKNRHKSRRRKVLAALAVLSLCASALLVLLFAWASRHNYPGAHMRAHCDSELFGRSSLA